MSDDVKKGLLGIVVDETTISQVVPDINSLTYRGYAVQDLCAKCIFEEVAYLVLNGELPNKTQLKKMFNFLRKNDEVVFEKLCEETDHWSFAEGLLYNFEKRLDEAIKTKKS